MGFIKAFTGAISQTFADQWLDYYMPNSNITAKTIVSPAVQKNTNAGAGQNLKGSENVITNGSKFVVPENFALVTIQDGKITNFVAEAGGYEFTSENNPEARSFFSGGGIFASTLGTSWDKFKFGGIPSTTQLAFYVNLKTIPNNKFGTQQPIRWMDSFLDTQVSALARGNYDLNIVDPVLFISQHVPYEFLSENAKPFDLDDFENDLSEQLFADFVSCLPQAFGAYTTGGEKTIMDITSDQIGIGKAIAKVLEESYEWSTKYGITVGKVAIESLDYDEETNELLKEVRQDDKEVRKMKKMGAAYSENMAGMMAMGSLDAMKTAAGNDNGAMMGFMGMNVASMQANNIMGAAAQMQPAQPEQSVPAQEPAQSEPTQAAPAEDPYAKLASLKGLLDQGVITQEDFDAAKKKLLGL